MIEENPEQANLERGEARLALPAREILAAVIRGRKTLLTVFLIPVMLSLVVALALPSTWQSEAHLLVLPGNQYAEQPLGEDNAPLPGADSDQLNKIEVEILGSREVGREAAKTIGPQRLDPSLPADAASGPDYERSLDIAGDEMERSLVAEPQSDSSVIHVRFSHRNADVARDGLRAVLDAYLARRAAIFDSDRVTFLLTKRDEADAQLERARTELAGFRQSHDIVSLPTQIALLLEEQSKLTLSSMQAQQAAAEKRAAGAVLASTSAALPKKVTLVDDRDAQSESGNSRSILLGLQLRRQELLSKYADSSHFITDLDQQIQALKSFEESNGLRTGRSVGTGVNPVVEEVQSDLRSFEQDLAGSEARSEEVGRQAENVQDRLFELSSLQLEHRRLERAVELADSELRLVAKHYEDAKVADAVDRQGAANVRVTQLTGPERRSGGNRRLVLGAGVIIGFVSALLAAFVGPAFRETMLTPGAAARQLRLPALASIPMKGDDLEDAALSGDPTGRGRRRRVLIIVENLPVPFDRRVWNEATTLAGAGYDVTVICPAMKPHLKRYEVIEGIRIYRHWLPQASGALGYALEYGTALAMQSWLAWRIFLGRGFDAIHACNPPDTIFLVALPFKLLFRRRFLFDHHDLNPELYTAKFARKDMAYRLLGLLERWTFRSADVSIATNESYRRVAIERGGMTSGKVFVVRSGPNLGRFLQSSPDPALKNGRAHLVAYVGTMGRQEGIHYLLEAARQIRDRHQRRDILYRLAGHGPEVPLLKLLVRGMGLDEDVIFEGRVSDGRLTAILATASLCVNPDEANELNDKSTMNKIMEYMAAGKPIVQFDLTEGRFSAEAASDYARPNDAADLADKIVALLDDPERRRRMGEYGRRRVIEHLSWDHEAPKLLEAYDALFRSR